MVDADAADGVEGDAREREAFLKIARAVHAYDADAARLLERWRARLERDDLPKRYDGALDGARRDVRTLGAKAKALNYDFLRCALHTFVDNERAPAHLRIPSARVAAWSRDEAFRAERDDVDKVRYVLKNVWRDWSEEGARERKPVYDLIFSALREKLGAIDACVGSPVGEAPRVLVPGCGLGRLVFELAKLGYDAQGNEFSYYMLMFSSFLLNATSEVGEFGICPWMHSRSNHREAADMWRETRIPDEVPGDANLPPGAMMSMAAGDFAAVYGEARETGMWDAVVTCFFIDTAHNIVEYLECIANCLRPGGCWVNFGPLLYHWEEYVDEQSVELSLEEVLAAAESFGLRVERSESTAPVDYTSDPRSMHKTTYSCAFIVATKV
jgi:carnosine N-methyltransferase